jgi:hypothetical protein
VVRKVIGKLPITADGAILMDRHAYFFDPYHYKNGNGEYVGRVTDAYPSDKDERWWFHSRDGKDVCRISECYSTHEAAVASRAGKSNVTGWD